MVTGCGRRLLPVFLLAQISGSQNYSASSVRTNSLPTGVQCLNTTYADRKAKWWGFATLTSTNVSICGAAANVPCNTRAYAVPYQADEVLTVIDTGTVGNVSTLAIDAPVRSFQTVVVDATTGAPRSPSIGLYRACICIGKLANHFAKFAKLWRARSRLYRSRFLRVSMRSAVCNST